MELFEMLGFPCSIVQKVNINSLTFELDFTFYKSSQKLPYIHAYCHNESLQDISL